MRRFHTGTELEPVFMQALTDGPRTIQEIYRFVLESGVLLHDDLCAIPTSDGYRRLRDIGQDVAGASPAEKQALVKRFGLPSEPYFQNAIRYARRQLLRKGSIQAQKRGLVSLLHDVPAEVASRTRGESVRSKGVRSLLPPEAADESDRDAERVTEVHFVVTSIRARRGQTRFRNALRRHYGDRCIVTGDTLVDVLEAAHVRPVSLGGVNSIENGLLLRSDVHVLFDLDLIGIDPETLQITVSSAIASSTYARYHGLPAHVTMEKLANREALWWRWARFLEPV